MIRIGFRGILDQKHVQELPEAYSSYSGPCIATCANRTGPVSRPNDPNTTCDNRTGPVSRPKDLNTICENRTCTVLRRRDLNTICENRRGTLSSQVHQ